MVSAVSSKPEYRPLADIQFIDSLLGYGITGDQTAGDTNYIIKTTNGGNNWFVINTLYKDLSRVEFINENTGYVSGGGNGITALFIKTTNGGMNWMDINISLTGYIDDIFVLNEDTIWYTEERTVVGGLFRTTDAGATWVRQFYAAGNIPSKIYMINAQVGFFSSGNASRLNKTTNSGFNWTTISGENGFQDIYFADSLTGWKSNGDMKKTIDGGLNWINQQLPPKGGIILTSGIYEFSNVNTDTIWGAGGQVFYGSGRFRGIVYGTTNGGSNWLIQIPDTSFNIHGFYDIQFLNKLTGWSFGASPNNFSNIHTITGGDTTFYTKIKEVNTEIPNYFLLKQNYPNPFNPTTIIFYELRIASYVRLIVYDVSGKEIRVLVNQSQNSGSFEIRFDGGSLSSGVYFYRLEAEDLKGNLYSETKKMILIR